MQNPSEKPAQPENLPEEQVFDTDDIAAAKKLITDLERHNEMLRQKLSATEPSDAETRKNIKQEILSTEISISRMREVIASRRQELDAKAARAFSSLDSKKGKPQ